MDFHYDEETNVVAPAGENRPEAKVRNEQLLVRICEEDNLGRVLNVTQAIELLAAFKAKSVLQRVLYKVPPPSAIVGRDGPGYGRCD